MSLKKSISNVLNTITLLPIVIIFIILGTTFNLSPFMNIIKFVSLPVIIIYSFVSFLAIIGGSGILKWAEAGYPEYSKPKNINKLIKIELLRSALARFIIKCMQLIIITWLVVYGHLWLAAFWLVALIVNTVLENMYKEVQIAISKYMEEQCKTAHPITSWQ